MTNHDATISELRAESERTRAALTNSVHELRNRIGATATDVKTMVSPSHIKDEVKSYVRETGNNFVDSLTAHARDNPLQAVAAGAALAFPLLKMTRAVPLPLLLIGAGFWFSSARGRETLDTAREKLGEVAETAGQQASDLLSSAKSSATQAATDLKDAAIGRASETAGSVSSTVQPLIDKTRATVHDMRDAAGSVVDRARYATSSATSSAMDSASNSASAAQSMADGVTDRARRFADGAMEAGVRSQRNVIDFVENNPLLTAAVGLAAGAFLAAAFPATSAERKLMGGSSARLQRAGRDAVSQGIDKASQTAEEALLAAADALEREGLSADGIKESLRQVTEKARAVAEKGLASATTHAQANGAQR
jgi:ElaB/YqjD/DUF883 family membrane-anchored ribosome-binding protein